MVALVRSTTVPTSDFKQCPLAMIPNPWCGLVNRLFSCGPEPGCHDSKESMILLPLFSSLFKLQNLANSRVYSTAGALEPAAM